MLITAISHQLIRPWKYSVDGHIRQAHCRFEAKWSEWTLTSVKCKVQLLVYPFYTSWSILCPSLKLSSFVGFNRIASQLFADKSVLEWAWEQIVPESSSAATARSAICTTFWLSPWWASSAARVSTAPRACSSLHSFSGEVGRMSIYTHQYIKIGNRVYICTNSNVLVPFLTYKHGIHYISVLYSHLQNYSPWKSAFNITMKVCPLSWMHAGDFSLVTTLDYWLGLGTRLRSFQLPQTLLCHSPFWLATLSRHPQATHFSLSPPSPASREDHCLATSTIRGQPPLFNTWKRLSSAVENEHAYTSSSWYPNELEEFRYWFDSAGLIS